MDRAADERKYEEEVLTEVLELEAESEGEYQKKLAEYHKQLEEWKLWRKKQVLETGVEKLSLFLLITSNKSK